ncbi:MAG: hypothetical protein NTX25_04350 [Proteobacteria bacterium]|nr:hypothetical protein [Pseudomonadota bacterium]
MRRHEEHLGFSTIELMMVVGILSIIVVYSTSRSHQQELQATKSQVRAETLNELNSLAKYVQNDSRFRADANVSLCPAGTCNNFTINRYNANGVSFQISYSTSCPPIPTEFLEKIPSSFSSLNGACFQAVNCPANTYPQIHIDVLNLPAGSIIENHPAKTPVLENFTANQKGVYKNMVGAAICLIDNPIDHVTNLHIDAAIIDPNSKTLQLLSKNVSLVGGSNAGQVTLLPAH